MFSEALPPTITNEIDALVERAWALRLVEPRAGIELAAEAHTAAAAAGYRHGEAMALRASGACRCVTLDHDAALADLAAAGRMFDDLGDVAGRASTLNWTGRVHYRRAEYAEALRVHGAAMQLVRDAGTPAAEGETLNYMGNVYLMLGDVPGALEHYHTALRIHEATGDRLGISHCLNNIGSVYGELGQAARALEYHQRALRLKREIGDGIGEVLGLSNVGKDYDSLGDYPRAIEYFTAALERFQQQGDRLAASIVLTNLGEMHRKAADYERALATLHESVEIARAAEDAMGECNALLGLGRTRLAMEEPAAAIPALGEALALALRMESRVEIYETYLELANAYEAVGDTAKALGHFRAYQRVKDEVFNAEVERRVQAVLVKVEVETAEREAALLRTRNDALTAANEEKARLLEVLKKQAAELDRLSREDALTGLFNRRHVDAALALEWERARRFGRDLAVAIVDLDHFKEVNDRFSHAMGDAVLREAARLLRDGVRAVDVAGRWGGEEFVLLLVETPPDRAALACEKLRAALEAHDWSSIAPGLRVTASMGVAGNAEAADPVALLAAADARLYAAKHAGRNRVVAGG